jgi:P-type E1-E2 ATPase
LQETKLDIFKNCINLLTIAVPPALPLALSIGLSVSFTRLQQKGIYCINPNRIVNAGRINTLCFDKTGTLTEDGLSLKGALPVIKNQNTIDSTVLICGNLEEDIQNLYLSGDQVRLASQVPAHHFKICDIPTKDD